MTGVLSFDFMKTNDFYFDLPDRLIAQYPTAERGLSRLMVMDRKKGRPEHRMVRDLPSLLGQGTVAVFNNSRVRKARLLGVSEASGAIVEFLLIKKTDDFCWQVLAKRAKRRRSGDRYAFDDAVAEVLPPAGAAAGEGTLTLRFDRPIDDAWLDIHGHVPLPPYIKRKDSDSDAERYQTVYAREYGSAASPTAGLHFTEELLERLRNAGIEITFVTLHVGLGTFLPVRTENIEEHRMHEENYSIDDENALRMERAKAEGRKILAVGTTCCRVLESAWIEGGLKRGGGSTSIFIYPGFDFKVVDELFTNFHTPFSTLLMLVSAFAGQDFVFDSYREAVKEGYRFFSYGDACLIV
jgi:S-adenosylmethionine:tRNA ribosyltransferase-isomerase